jgi:two-component system KDP operon response regulator KdpE
VTVGGEDVRLTRLEYKLLVTMAQHAGKVLTHQFLLEKVWGPKRAEDVQHLRVFMAGLRRKIEQEPAQPRYLITEQGVGYRLAAE